MCCLAHGQLVALRGDTIPVDLQCRRVGECARDSQARGLKGVAVVKRKQNSVYAASLKLVRSGLIAADGCTCRTFNACAYHVVA